jgi:virulence-associated protein VagC
MARIEKLQDIRSEAVSLPTWGDFFALVAARDLGEDFLTDRNDAPPQERDLF